MLNGKVAVVTGGSRGIGRAVAIKLAALGADVAVVYAANSDLANETVVQAVECGVRSEAFCCDVSDYGAVKETVSAVRELFGTVDILVNNAGITRDGLIISMKEEAFDSVIGTNLKGTFNMIRHTAPIMVRNRFGRIVNISSVAGVMGNAGQSNYSASKAGVIGLTKSVARELASRGITCNAIAPGFIATDMTVNVDSEGKLMSSIPLGRVGTVEEVGEVAAFLAMSGYITGEVIRIDGGLAI